MGAILHDLYTIEAATWTEDLKKIPLEDFLPYLTEKSIHYLQVYKTAQSSKPFFFISPLKLLIFLFPCIPVLLVKPKLDFMAIMYTN